MLLASPYLLAASIRIYLIADAGPGWLNLLVVLFIWNALKFLIKRPVSFVLWICARVREAFIWHRA